jgi:hypothetical protein
VEELSLKDHFIEYFSGVKPSEAHRFYPEDFEEGQSHHINDIGQLVRALPKVCADVKRISSLFPD